MDIAGVRFAAGVTGQDWRLEQAAQRECQAPGNGTIAGLAVTQLAHMVLTWRARARAGDVLAHNVVVEFERELAARVTPSRMQALVDAPAARPCRWWRPSA